MFSSRALAAAWANGPPDPIAMIPCSGSITGGKVYRGNDLPLLRGHYFYIDYCKGGLRSFAFEDGQVVEQTNWDFLNPPSTVVSFGTDGFGEMYLMAGSSVYKFVSTANPRCDFDGDGDGDLPVGVPGENRSGTVDAGMLQVFDGNGSGFDPAADGRFWQGTNGVRGMLERLDEFGAAVACGDFDGDGFSDLAIGSPGERRNLRKQAGQVNVLYGGSNEKRGGRGSHSPATVSRSPMLHPRHDTRLPEGSLKPKAVPPRTNSSFDSVSTMSRPSTPRSRSSSAVQAFKAERVMV